MQAPRCRRDEQRMQAKGMYFNGVPRKEAKAPETAKELTPSLSRRQ